MSAGSNYYAFNIPLLSTMRMYHGRGASGSGFITLTTSQRRSCTTTIPPLARALGSRFFATFSFSRQRQTLGNGLNFDFCGAVRYVTIRKFSPSGSPNHGEPHEGRSKSAPQNYVSRLLNLPLAQLGRVDRPTVSLVVLQSLIETSRYHRLNTQLLVRAHCC